MKRILLYCLFILLFSANLAGAQQNAARQPVDVDLALEAGDLAAVQHTVKAGETPSGIAKRYGVSWQEMLKLNRIDDPKRLQIGKVLQIPAKGRSVAAKAPEKLTITVKKAVITRPQADVGPFKWNHVGTDPVGRSTDPAPYIRKMGLPKEVENAFIAIADAKDYVGARPATITMRAKAAVMGERKFFSKFDFMGFGKNGQLKKDVVVNFPQMLPAVYWTKEYQGKIYNLVLPDACQNWALFIEDAPKKQVPVQDKPAPAPQKDPEPAEEIPPATVAPPVTEAAPTKEKPFHVWDPDVEAWLYAGHTRNFERSSDKGSYWGITASAFIDKWRMGEGFFRIGPSWQRTWWDGVSGNVGYKGNHNLFGAEAQFLTDTTKTQLKVLFGEKRGNVWGNGFPYYAREWADLIAIEGAHQWWGHRDLFFDVEVQDEVGGRAEIAINNGKQSTWEGRPIPRSQDPANDQSVYSARVKRTWMYSENVMPTLELSGGLKRFNDSSYVQVQPGVKLFKEVVEVHGILEAGSRDDDNVYGVGARVNLSKLGKEVYNFLKS